ncbi:MAG TPA: exosome complex exonuclease Rrp41 [Candidatus Nanoarchaeia archaeon]|nr:exosome complex exonuclease Rrp41 [Candidatus Nanoarchaeia archaeon]
MAFTRPDNRKVNDFRDIEAKAGIIKRADGSGYFRIGKTVAYAAVYGPRDLYPRFLQNPQKGILRCSYNMMPFSGSGERVRPGTNRRSREISHVTEKALLPVLDLTEFPNAVVDVFIELPQTDAGTRCAGICAASIALADAGIPMRDMVSAIAAGYIGGTALIDVSKEEEDYAGGMADIPIALLPRTGEITLLQMDGIMPKDQLKKAIMLAKEACKKIITVQQKALKEKYGRW